MVKRMKNPVAKHAHKLNRAQKHKDKKKESKKNPPKSEDFFV